MTETPNRPTPARSSVLWTIRRLELVLGYFAAVILFVTMGITLADVIGRNFFSTPMPAGHELTELMVGLLVYGAIPLITIRNQQITIELFSSYLRGFVRRLLDVLLPLFGAAVMALFGWRLLVQAGKLQEFGSATIYLQLPVFPFVFFMGGMAVLSAVVYVLLAVFRIKLRIDDEDTRVTSI